MNEPDYLIVLKDRGWSEKYGLWSNLKRVYNDLPYLFTLKQVLKIEGLE